MGRNSRLAVVDGGLPVCDRFLLDASSFLGAQLADEGRIRESGRADDARRAGRAKTRRQILLYTLLLYAVSQLPFCAGAFGGIYLVSSILLGGAFIGGAVWLYRRADRRAALRLYLFSLLYLALLFGAMVADVKL